LWKKWVATTLPTDSKGNLIGGYPSNYATINRPSYQGNYSVAHHSQEPGRPKKKWLPNGIKDDVESAIAFANSFQFLEGNWQDNTGDAKINGQTYEEYHQSISQDNQTVDFSRQMQREKDENKKPNETDYDYHDRQVKAWEQKLKQGHAIEEVQKYLDYHRARVVHYSQGKVQQGGQQAPHQPGQPPIAQPNVFAAPTLKQYNTEYVNMNPLDYQTPTSFSQVSGYASQPFWDQANDMLPEYRYAMPWSSSYLPVNEWRPNDQQGWPAGLPFDPRTR
jgi:hypothetical protein